jgi:hypothetical protein
LSALNRITFSEPIPLGVGDAAGRVGAIGLEGCDIDLIDLLVGDQLRRWPQIGCPLMLDGPCLVGWRRENRAPEWRLFRAALPPADAPVEWSPTLDLPEWARGTKLDFTINLARSGDRYLVYWKAQTRYHGAPPPPGPAHHKADGGVAIDTGTLQPVAPYDGGIFTEERGLASRGEHLARQARGFTYRQNGRLRNAPWSTPAGERFLRTLGRPGEKQQRLSIARADDPGLSNLVEFDTHDLDETAPELSLDGCHLAVVYRNPDGEAQWRVYSTETGEMAASVPYRTGFDSFRIFGQRLICLEETRSPDREELAIHIERRLHAMRADDGRVLWSYVLPTVTIEDMSFLPP